MLEFKNVEISYGGVPFIKGFNLTVDTGEIASIVGESGSGKTTIIRAALGLLANNGRVSAGDIILDGQNLMELSEKDWLKYRGEEIAMIFQDAGSMLNPVRTIGKQFIEMIKIHRPEIEKEEAYKMAVESLEAMKLDDPDRIMSSYTFQLSGGMRQRVGIAMALVFNPNLLLADEPTSALDVTTQAQIVEQMVRLNQEHNDHQSIIIVTHNIGVAAYMSHKIVVMKDGKIVEFGTREQVICNPQSDFTKKLLDSVPTMKCMPLKGKRGN